MIASMQGRVNCYGTQVVLDYIGLDIAQVEIIGLLGPNGAGKTTFIHPLSPVNQGKPR